MNCGIVSDGCGDNYSCSHGATCPEGLFCGGAGIPNVCGSSTAIPLPDGGVMILDGGIDAGSNLCVSSHFECDAPDGAVLLGCGSFGDGCGLVTFCGATCQSPQVCGPGNGSYPPVCGNPCTPSTTCPAGVTCGPGPDGCGGTIPSCGPACAAPDLCGANGAASQCADAG
jgi:hypothetical protein